MSNPVLDAKPHAQNLLLARVQVLQHFRNIFSQELTACRIGRHGCLLVHDKVPEARILFVPLVSDGRINRHCLLGNLLKLMNFGNLNSHFRGNFLRGRLPSQLLHERPRRLRVFIQSLHHVHRNSDGPRLIRKSARDRLPDPPGRVS